MNPELLALDPFLKNNLKMFIYHINELERTENVPIELYNFHNHVIKFVEICGLIVGVDNKSTKVYYTVDDSTGTIPCCYWIGSNFKYKPLELGTLVRVLGKIATYRGEKQIIIDDIFPLKNPNEELAHFIEKYTLLQKYKLPYQLPTEEDMRHDLRDSKLEFNSETSVVSCKVKALSNLIVDILDKKYGKNKPFTITQVRNNEEVIALSKQILIQQGEKPEQYRIVDLFNDAVNKLMSEGRLSAEGTKNGLYVLVDKIEIEQFVMKTMSDVFKSNEGIGGIHRAYIATKLKEKYNFEKKTAAVVTQITIADLFDKGFVYPTIDKKFKITFQ